VYPERPTLGVAGSVAANAVILAVLAYTYWLTSTDVVAAHAAYQEDEWAEWASFWGFFGASVVYGAVAWRQWRTHRAIPWFAVGMGLMCFGVAGEEISWGQRLLGFEPSTYFLENNFQQETNLHNIVETSLRKRVYEIVVGVTGLVLPIAAVHPDVGPTLKRWRVTAPPIELVPSFAAALAVYVMEPWPFAGEVSELLFAMALVAAAAPWWAQAEGHEGRPDARRGLALAAGGVVVTLALGVGLAALSTLRGGADPARARAAHRELDALAQDLLGYHETARRRRVRCGYDQRLYTHATDHRMSYLFDGAFAARTGEGLSENRARFFLDPWSTAYWMRMTCDRETGRMTYFVYSFGPNRRRDSTGWEAAGDDILAYVIPPGTY